ncbi:hypothetical protein EC973_004583 [Apophysomyces ossiformis]|uniref:Methyltransferase domain-containing protein n=1 Tax=Apophysomyces ossiformis TaxID=679940 RepID=A0A8H7BZN1_9FUNG|nr:hypothetical protein EC973_004583 [Apophysomyces ossiformis]
MDHINYVSAVVPPSDNNVRIKKWLLTHYRHAVKSKECVRRSFQRKEISVNGKVAEETRILTAGDVVEVRYDRSMEELERFKQVEMDVRYQDEHLAIVWKPAGQNFGIFERALQHMLQNPTGERVWCIYSLQKAASGLLLVAKTAEARTLLLESYEASTIDLQMRVMCHGHVPPDLLSRLPNTIAPTPAPENLPENQEEDDEGEQAVTSTNALQLIKRLNVVSVTRSNNADYITTLDLDMSTPLSSVGLRSLFFHHTPYPIIGNSTYTKFLKSSRDKGLCMSLLRISLNHPYTGEPIQIQANEPEKFELLRQREQKFWRRKIDQELEEMRKAGLEVDDAKYFDELEISDRKKKPLAYVLGEKEFCGLRFKVTESCLIPRPSSETLVYATVQSNPRRVLDIGTGSGNLLISILKLLPEAVGVGVDISKEALDVAMQNATKLDVADRCTFVLKDMAELEPTELFDVVVCNPPYLNLEYVSKQKEQMQMLEHEPSDALFAKEQGYEWYTVLSKVAPMVLRPSGRVVLECGKGMIERVKIIWSGWKVVEVRTDAQGFQRCLVLELL